MDDGTDPNYPGRPSNYPLGQDACNYDPTFCHDDGSCVYGDCMDAEAANYNPNAACNQPAMCDYKWSCDNSGYALTDCAQVGPMGATTPPPVPFNQGNILIDTHPTNANYFDMGHVPQDNPEGSTWVNAGHELWMSRYDARVVDILSQQWVDGVPQTTWLYSDPNYQTEDIG